MGLRQLNDLTCNSMYRELRHLGNQWDDLRIESMIKRDELDREYSYKARYEAEVARANQERGCDSWVFLRGLPHPACEEYLREATLELEKVEKKINKIVSCRVALIRRLEELEMEELRIPAALR